MTTPLPPVIDTQDVTIRFRRRRSAASLFAPPPTFRAVAEASLTIARQEVLGLVGESGSGKTTLGRAILRLYEPTEGTILFEGHDITHLREARLRPIWRRMALVFQDPLSSFNPRHTIGTALATPSRIAGQGTEASDRVTQSLRRVGLPLDSRDRYPHELSGGQLQRAALARALMLSPAFVVADEAVSKLDVSVRSQVLNLFRDVQAELGIAFLFITHDLHVARYVSDRVAVMFFGRIVETAPAQDLFRTPRHPYTRALLATLHDNDAAAPAPAPAPALAWARARTAVDQEAQGCIYRSQCPRSLPRCAETHPPTATIAPGHTLACYNPA